MTNEELVDLYQAGDKQALEKLLEQNKGIVYKLVNKFYVDKTNSIDKEDLEQEGFIGLITASNKYDINNPKKAKFITDAVFWINQKINGYMKQKNTNDETSLNNSISEDGDNELMDYIEGVDYEYENVEEKIYIKQLHEEMDQVMFKYNTLKEREIIKMHYGFDSSKQMTLQEIGDIFNVTRSTINQSKSVALGKIRRSPWGSSKAKELYIQKINISKYNFQGVIERINFEDRYLS